MAGLEMRYFVLSPASGDTEHAVASRSAIREYANVILISNPQLATDLRQWVDDIESPSGNVEFEKSFEEIERREHGLSEKRDTFEIPDGWTAERDGMRRATGYLVRDSDGFRCHHLTMKHMPVQVFDPAEPIDKRAAHAVMYGDGIDHEGADIRQDRPRNLLEEPPEGWFVEKDDRTTHPTGYLVRTEDGTRKWHTDPMFKQG